MAVHTGLYLPYSRILYPSEWMCILALWECSVHEVLPHWALVCWSSIVLRLQTCRVSMKTVKTYKKPSQGMMWCRHFLKRTVCILSCSDFVTMFILTTSTGRFGIWLVGVAKQQHASALDGRKFLDVRRFEIKDIYAWTEKGDSVTADWVCVGDSWSFSGPVNSSLACRSLKCV